MGLKRNTLPARFVKNKVLWSTRLNVPFRFKKGESTKVGVFLTPNAKEKQTEVDVFRGHYRTGVVGKAFFTVLPQHFPTGVVGKALFKARGRVFKARGRVYRDLDVKGVGHTDLLWTPKGTKSIVAAVTPRYVGGEPSTYGILSHRDAQNEIRNAQKFLRAGIRTALPLAEIKLEEIINSQGKPVSIQQARERKMLHEKEGEPVLLLRAFGTKLRVNNLIVGTTANAKKAVKDAKSLLSREFGKKFTDAEYTEWFAANLARQVARMHSKGWTHNYLSGHNITLDGRIVDLDSITRMVKGKDAKKAIKYDLKSARNTLYTFGTGLITGVGVPVNQQHLANVFHEEYLKNVRRGKKVRLADYAELYENI